MSSSEVTIVSDNGSKLQWGKSLFYMKEGEKTKINQKTVKVFGVTLFSLITLTTGALTPDTNRYVEPKLVNQSVGSGRIKILSYLDTISKEAKERKKKASREQKQKYKRLKVSRLTVISRGGMDKIPPGSEARAILSTAATDGIVKAKLVEDLEVSGELFLPEGSTLIGIGASGDERLNIGFHTVVFEDGTSQKISGMAYDSRSKLLGLIGPRMGRRAIMMAASAGLNIVAGASQVLQETDIRGGIATQRPNMKNAILQGVGLAAVEQSKEMMENLKDKQTQIFVKAGTKILIIFQEVGS